MHNCVDSHDTIERKEKCSILSLPHILSMDCSLAKQAALKHTNTQQYDISIANDIERNPNSIGTSHIRMKREN